ncbi:hypothetical protein [Bradyrhizobium sp. USDA 10063]
MADKAVNGAKLEKIPIKFQLRDHVIDGAVIRPMSFQNFADYISEANAMKGAKTFEARLRRVRLSKQIAYYINGTIVPVAVDDVLQLPIPEARKLLDKIDDNEGQPGKIIRDGDGIDKAITYELGTPIPVGADKPPISELEFHARTYGDVEDIMAAPDGIQQTMQLISTIAKPLGTSLIQLPSWAINLITVTDGIVISRDVLPRFLGSPDE